VLTESPLLGVVRPKPPSASSTAGPTKTELRRLGAAAVADGLRSEALVRLQQANGLVTITPAGRERVTRILPGHIEVVRRPPRSARPAVAATEASDQEAPEATAAPTRHRQQRLTSAQRRTR
jgi:hypothetical protein